MMRTVLIAVSGLVGICQAQTVNLQLNTPTLDRWMYSFNSDPGHETSASTFGAILQAGFDDRDAQILLEFDTSAQVTPGLPPAQYRIQSLRVKAVQSSDLRCNYDPTFDAVTSLYADGDPLKTVDTDPGRPIDLFGVGFRNGQSAATFAETTAFSTVPPFPPTQGVRSVFAAAFDAAGVATDISLQVNQRLEAHPWAIATANLQPGALIPPGTEMTFEVDLCAPYARAYFQQGLARGRLLVMITSLSPTSGGPGGGTGDPTYPAFYMKESPIAAALGWAAKLQATIVLGSIADMNADQGVTIDDLLIFLEEFEAGGTPSDVNGDCGVTVDDLLLFLDAFERG